MSETTATGFVKLEKCDHCHGVGHTTCSTCHGTGEEECPSCHGTKKVTCSKCKGKGHFSNCSKCGSTGKMACSRCGGTGKVRERCANCGGSGKVRKERYHSCGNCHGRGEVWTGSYYNSCSVCKGTGQVKEEYKETCPTCGGIGKTFEVTCPSCRGRKTETCDRCNGTGHARCQECSGDGWNWCEKCDKTGKVTCHECHGLPVHVCVPCYGTGCKSTLAKVGTADGEELMKQGRAFRDQKQNVQAFNVFREAAMKYHNAEALRRLAWMYDHDLAVYKDADRALILYRLAANSGNIHSLYLLGKKYADGEGVPKNRSEARRLLELAVQKGIPKAKEELAKVQDAELTSQAVSGVVGWQEKFEVPQFLIDADPAADQKDKDDKEAARKAKIEQEKRAKQRKLKRQAFCRGIWFFLFRVAAAVAFFSCLKDSYTDMPDDDLYAFVAMFFVASYAIRPKFGFGGYLLIGIATPIAALCVNSTDPMWSVPLFLFMSSFFMRWMGEYLKLPMLTYPLVGALVGFSTSFFAVSHGVFDKILWWYSCMGLSGLFLIIDLGLAADDSKGVAVQGDRKANWGRTLWILGICGLAAGYIAMSVGTEKRFSFVQKEEQKDEEAAEGSASLLSLYEQAVRFRDGNGIEKDMALAKKKFAEAIEKKERDEDVLASEVALGKILLDEGSFDEATKHLVSASRKGNAESLLYLGKIQQKKGKTEAAIKLYRAAADKGVVDAMLVLGRYYSEKTGGLFNRMRDGDLAEKYLKMAAQTGNEEAKRLLQAMK